MADDLWTCVSHYLALYSKKNPAGAGLKLSIDIA